MITFETENFGRIEIRDKSENEPNGYIYFARDDYETEFLPKGRSFKDIWGRRFTVILPPFPNHKAQLQVWMPRTIAVA